MLKIAGSSIHSDCFEVELKRKAKEKQYPCKSNLHSLNLFIGRSGLLRVGGRQDDCNLTCARRYLVILQGEHQLTQLIIRHEHLQLLHAGSTLLTASLNRRF